MSTWNVGNEDLSWISPRIIDIEETWGPEQRYYSQENLRWTDRKKIFACRGWFVACWPNVVALLCGYLARNKYISRKLHSCEYLYGTGDVSNSRTLYVGKINRTSLLVNFQTKSIRWWGSSRGNNGYGEKDCWNVSRYTFGCNCVRRPPLQQEKTWMAGNLDGNTLVSLDKDDNGENSFKKILKLSFNYLQSPHLIFFLLTLQSFQMSLKRTNLFNSGWQKDIFVHFKMSF